MTTITTVAISRFLLIEHVQKPGIHRKISISSFFKVLWLSDLKSFSKDFVCSGETISVAPDHQRELTIEAWKWLFLLLKNGKKWYLDTKSEVCYQFSSNGNRKQWVFFYLESFLLISDISGFSFFVIEHIRKPGNHGKFPEAHF